MRTHNPPSLIEPHPHLALPSAYYPIRSIALELKRHAAEVFPKRHNLQPPHPPCKVYGSPRLPEGLNLIDTIEVLACTQPHRIRRSPEHRRQRLDIILYQRSFI